MDTLTAYSRQAIMWLRVKHTTITQAILSVIGAGQVLGWWTLSDEELGAVMMLVGAAWLLIGAQTTTSNLRLTGRAFDAPHGVDVDRVASHALGELGPIPDAYIAPTDEDRQRIADDAARDAGLQ